MILTLLVSTLLAVESSFGRNARKSMVGVVLMLLSGTICMTYLSFFLLNSTAMSRLASSLRVITASTSGTLLYLAFFVITQTCYHPILYRKIGLSTVMAYLFPFVLAVSFFTAVCLNFMYNRTVKRHRDNAV